LVGPVTTLSDAVISAVLALTDAALDDSAPDLKSNPLHKRALDTASHGICEYAVYFFLATWGCPARVLVATMLFALINYVIVTSELLRCAVTSEGDFASVVVIFGSSRDVQLTRLRPHCDILYRHKQALNLTT